MPDQKATILLVEDDMNLGFVVQDNLKMSGYKVVLSSDGKQGLKQFNEGKFDLCLLDVMLPYKDGFSLAEDIRKTNKEIPIIFLTAKSMTEDKIKGFRSGGDDYITKPFSTEELLLRIEAILKRIKPAVEQNKDVFTIGKYVFDSSNYNLKIDGNEQKLTKKEAEILKLLCAHKGEVLPRELVLNMIWGDDNYFNGRSLDVFLTKLRKYLKDDEKVTITNVHGVGFRLQDE
ncbi:MAG: response regulator transcription factor [Flavobacteriales bacterium]|nr:response regulator transcription factor [Flavobacteriales bacterium]